MTAEIFVHSLANFHCQYADRDTNLQFMYVSTSESKQLFDNCLCKKNIDVSFSWVFPVIDNEFCL